MEEGLEALLRELEAFGAENDARAVERRDKMLNITRDTGAFLSLLVQALAAGRVLEIGTSNGYSTLWLAQAVERTGGRVTTLEVLEHKAAMAEANFARSGLRERIRLLRGDAGQHLATQPDGAHDFIFLDADRGRYAGWWPDLTRVLAPGGLIVVDNAISHAAELEDFRAVVEGTPGFVTSLMPVGKGEWLVLKQR